MTQQKTKIYGLILAGGYSKRMGQDKALLDFHGMPQIEYVHELLSKHCSKVYLSKRPNQKPYKRIMSIDDDEQFADSGPLGGILSAMKKYPNESWLVMACDLPFVDHKALKTIMAARDEQKLATAFISSSDALPEPLCAIWEGRGYAAILQLFNEGIKCPRKILIKSNAHLITQINPRWLDNVNTLQEYNQTKEILGSICLK